MSNDSTVYHSPHPTSTLYIDSQIDTELIDNIDSTQIELTTVDISNRDSMGNTPSHTRDEKLHLLNPVQHNGSYNGYDNNELQFSELRDKHKVSTIQYLLYCIIPLIITTLSLCILIFTYAVPLASPSLDITVCDILCNGPIISILQKSNIFVNDTKQLVDMPLKYSPQQVWHNFWDLQDLKTTTIQSFINDNFNAAGSDVLHWLPDDYDKHGLTFIETVHDPIMAGWALDIHSLWGVLGRQLSDRVYQYPNRHTLIPLKNRHMIVPGGRFLEFYYWDSYWIVRGLLSSNMYDTARMVVENLLDLVDRFGFVPNGSRMYYLNRSQPPFLVPMVHAIYTTTLNHTFLQYALPLLDKEYEYWMDVNTHAVELIHPNDTTNTSYLLNRYYSDVSYPRPESFLADETTAIWLMLSERKHIPLDRARCTRTPLDALSCISTSYMNNREIKKLMSELTASAESGWDFASRWFYDRANLTTANTLQLIPVDLNSYMAINERTLSELHQLVNNNKLHDYYHTQYNQRVQAIQLFLFNEATYQWNDYNFVEQSPSGSSVSVSSNFIPLYAKSYNKCIVNETRVIESLLSSGLIMQGGIVTSLDNDKQQWDYPNAWAPIQHMLIDGISTSTNIVQHSEDNQNQCITEPSELGINLGASIARQWLYSNFLSYNSTGVMMEKYYAPALGAGTGVGGEYTPQTGFGWTNGVALILLQQYGDSLNFTEWYEKHKHSIIKDRYTYHPLHQRYVNPNISTPISWTQPDVVEAEYDAAENIHHHHAYHDPHQLYSDNIVDQYHLLGPESKYIKLHNASIAAVAQQHINKRSRHKKQ